MPKVYKANPSYVLEVTHIVVCVNLVRFVKSFPLHKLRIIKRRFIQKLDDHLVVALKNLKKHKWVCLYLLENPRKKESVVVSVSFYWWVAIGC